MIVADLPPVRAGIVTLLVVVGSFFLAVGTIGLLRLPNVYNRMHATSKATTLGAASFFLAGTVYFSPVAVPVPVVGPVPILPEGAGLVSLVGILFLFATAPTGAHVVSRSAQKMGIDFVAGVQWPDQVEAGDQVNGDGEDAAESTTDEDSEVFGETGRDP